MTQEEKAKRYDEIVKVADKYRGTHIMFSQMEDEMFPELAESEDERIRKKLISSFKGIMADADKDELWYGLPYNDIIAWLEKQGKNISLPKFTFDDVLALQCCMVTVKKVQEDKELYEQLQSLHDRLHDAYWLEKQGGQTSSQTNERAWLYLVSDVLTWKDGIGQYLDDPRVQELAKKLCIKYAQKLYNPPVLSNSLNTGKNEQKPVEDRYMEGYLNGINDTLKPVWSEEDRETIDYLIDYLESELDSSYTDLDKETFTKEINLLKSLRPQTRWKPSDEQMEALEHFIVYHNGSTNYAKDLEELRLQLKKLKEK